MGKFGRRKSQIEADADEGKTPVDVVGCKKKVSEARDAQMLALGGVRSYARLARELTLEKMYNRVTAMHCTKDKWEEWLGGKVDKLEEAKGVSDNAHLLIRAVAAEYAMIDNDTARENDAADAVDWENIMTVLRSDLDSSTLVDGDDIDISAVGLQDYYKEVIRPALKVATRREDPNCSERGMEIHALARSMELICLGGDRASVMSTGTANDDLATDVFSSRKRNSRYNDLLRMKATESFIAASHTTPTTKKERKLLEQRQKALKQILAKAEKDGVKILSIDFDSSPEMLGDGGTCEVVRLYVNGLLFAAKRLKKEHLDLTSLHELYKEAVQLESLQMCRFFVRMYGIAVDMDEGHLYILMEPCDGDIFHLIHQADGSNFYDIRTKKGRERLGACFLQIINGLRFLHIHKKAHRDIKTNNMLYGPGGHDIKIADIGSIKDDMKRPRRNTANLTTMYAAAPETLSKHRYTTEYDHRVDVYGLGIILFELCTADMPFKEFSDEEIKEKKHDPDFAENFVLVRFEEMCKTQYSSVSVEDKREYRFLVAELKQIIALCLCSDPDGRPTLDTLDLQIQILFPGAAERAKVKPQATAKTAEAYRQSKR